MTQSTAITGSCNFPMKSSSASLECYESCDGRRVLSGADGRRKRREHDVSRESFSRACTNKLSRERRKDEKYHFASLIKKERKKKKCLQKNFCPHLIVFFVAPFDFIWRQAKKWAYKTCSSVVYDIVSIQRDFFMQKSARCFGCFCGLFSSCCVND